MGNSKDLIEKGRMLFDEGRYSLAIEAYLKVLELEPENVDVLIDIGLTYRHKEHYDKAIEFYERALEIEKDNKVALNNKGWVLECMEDVDGAMEMYRQSLKVDPAYESPLLNLVNIHRNRKEFYMEIELFKNALEADHLSAPNWIDLGRAYRQQEDYDNSIKAYSEALKLDPTSKIAWNNIGYVHYCKKDHDSAIEAYTRSMKIDWLYDLPFSNLITIYKEMIKEKNEDSSAWKNLANGFYIGRAYNRAIDSCNRALDIKPDLEEVLNLHGKIVKKKIKLSTAPLVEKKIEDALALFSHISFSALLDDVVGYIKYKNPEIIFKDDEIKYILFDTINKMGLGAKIDKNRINFFKKGEEKRDSLTI